MNKLPSALLPPAPSAPAEAHRAYAEAMRQQAADDAFERLQRQRDAVVRAAGVDVVELMRRRIVNLEALLRRVANAEVGELQALRQEVDELLADGALLDS